MSDGRMLIHEAGVRWKFNPAQPRQHGKWSGPSALPAQLQAAAHAAYEKAHPELPHKPWVSPPSPRGKKGGKPGGFTAVGITNTELGDKVEDALQRHLGMQNEHPGRRQGPLDLRFDGHGYEVKAVSSMADEYKAKPKASEIASKKAYAAEHGLHPHTMIVVYHPAEKQLYVYSKPGIGAYRLTNEANGWKFHGTVPLDLRDTSPEPEGQLAELRLGPQQKSVLDAVVREHLKLHPHDTAANVTRRMKDLGYKVEGEPGGYTYNHILEATKRLKAEAAAAKPAPAPQPPIAPKGLVPTYPVLPLPKIPAAYQPLSDEEAEAAEEAAYQDARKRGLSEYTARSDLSYHSSGVWNGDPTHQAQAKGLQRYIDERRAIGQKWQQARNDALTPPAEGWKHFTPDQVRAYYLGANKTFLDNDAEARSEQMAKGTNISLFKDGSKVVYRMPLGPVPPATGPRTYVVTPEQQKVLEQEVEKARRTYPTAEPLTVTVGQSATGGRFKPTVWGETYTGTGRIFLNAQIFGRSADKTTEGAVAQGHWMPSYKGQGAIRSVFSHELGHTVDSFLGNGTGRANNQGQTKKETNAARYTHGANGISAYGRKNTAEAFAEAFAEWHLSNGKTTNPIARRLAALEGWGVDPQASKGLAAIARARAISRRSLAAVSA